MATQGAGLLRSWRRWLWVGGALLLLGLAGVVWLGPAVESGPASGSSLRQLSIAELLAGHSDDWRLARLKELPEVVVIEFPSLAEQGAALNRIAALLEKAGAPRDRVLDDAELAALIARGGDNSQTFYQGHDYEGAELARFYAMADAQGVPLNAQERRLQQELLAIAPRGSAAPAASAPGAAYPAALITFTATQVDDPSTPADETVDAVRRASILRHEVSHGRFYTRPGYREHCRRFWREEVSESQRERIRAYLASIGYDRSDEDLMLNEAQAFIVHTADVRAFPPESVGLTHDEVSYLRRRFWQTLPPEEADGALSGAPPLAVGARP